MAGAAKVLTASGRAVRRLVFYVVLPLILLTLLAWQFFLPGVAEQAARIWLAGQGVENLDFTVDTIQLGGSTISDVSLGGGVLTADRIAVTYHPDRLRDGRADQITISGLRWATRVADGTVDLGPLQSLMDLAGDGVDSEATTGAPPVPEIELRDAEITLTGDFGAIVIPANGTVRFTPDGGITGSLSVSPRAAFASLRADIEFDRGADGKTTDLFAEIDDGWARAPSATALGLNGQVAFHLGDTGAVEASGYVDAAHLNTPLGDFPGSVAFAFADDLARADVNLATSDDALALSASAEGGLLPHPDLSFDVQLTAPSTIALERRGLSLFQIAGSSPRVAMSGRLTAASLGDIVESDSVSEIISNIAGDGHIELALADLTVPRLVEGLDAAGAIDLALSDGIFSLEAETLALSARRIDGQLFGVSPGHLLHPYLIGGADLRLSPRDTPLVLVQIDDEQRLDISVGGDLSLALGDVLAARAGADRIHVKLGVGGVSWRGVDQGRFELDNWTARPFGLRMTEAVAVIEGTDGRFGGTATIAADGAFEIDGGPRADDVGLRFATRLSFSGDHFTARLTNVDLVFVDALALPGENALTLAPIAVRAGKKQKRALVDAKFPDSGGVSWTGGLVLEPTVLESAIDLGDEGAAAISAVIPPLTFTGAGSFGGDQATRYDIAIDGTGGTARLATPMEPAPGLPLDASIETFSIAAKAKADQPSTVSIEAERIIHHARKPILPPLALTLDASIEGDAVAFTSRLREDSGNLVIDFAGAHDLARGQGQGETTLYPLLFLEDGLQPGRLSPYFAARFGPTTGTVSATGPIFWSDAGITSNLVLAIQDLSTAVDAVTVAGVNAAITFDRLLPPSTPPSQQIAIAGIDLGLPLTDGRVSVRLDRDAQPLVERSEWQWAGGKVATSYVRGIAKTKTIGGGDRLVLEIDGIELDRLLELTPQGTNIEATGTLFGRIPVVFRDGEFVIVDGWLESSFEGGTLRYQAAELEEGWLAGGEGVSLLLDALDNFNYSRLRVDLNGLPDGQTEMRFRIRGKNPDVYGGAEVELNMSVTGRLEQILRQSYEAYFAVPEEIARKLANQTPSVEGTATPIEGR